ncbi:MAG: hypothetical protein AAF982_06550 [Pseudomonadota bacterium]
MSKSTQYFAVASAGSAAISIHPGLIFETDADTALDLVNAGHAVKMRKGLTLEVATKEAAAHHAKVLEKRAADREAAEREAADEQSAALPPRTPETNIAE